MDLYGTCSRKELENILGKKLKDKLTAIVFLELKKDIKLKGDFIIPAGTLLPLKSEDLIKGIKENDFGEEISLDKFISGITYVLGSDREFQYNNLYIDILRNINADIESYIMARAQEYAEEKDYISALIFFNTLEVICNKPLEAGYNIANTLKNMAEYYRDNNERDYQLYNELSYNKFLDLSVRFDYSPYPYYHLGFYHAQKREYEKALDKWEKSYNRASDEKFKQGIKELMLGVSDSISYEDGKNKILDGNVMEGLKKLIPLAEKHVDWSEAKYYIALGYRKLGNYKKAEVILVELLERGENFSKLYNELGLCYFYLGHIQKAVDELQKAVNLNNNEPGYLCNLGIACWSLGEVEKAREYINKAYGIAPQDQLVNECRIWMERQ